MTKPIVPVTPAFPAPPERYDQRDQTELRRLIAQAFSQTSARQPKQTVTGAKGGNTALASVITALANLGLIVDSTT